MPLLRRLRLDCAVERDLRMRVTFFESVITETLRAYRVSEADLTRPPQESLQGLCEFCSAQL